MCVLFLLNVHGIGVVSAAAAPLYHHPHTLFTIAALPPLLTADVEGITFALSQRVQAEAVAIFIIVFLLSFA